MRVRHYIPVAMVLAFLRHEDGERVGNDLIVWLDLFKELHARIWSQLRCLDGHLLLRSQVGIAVLLELLQQIVHFFEWLQLLLDALVLPVSANLEAEGERDRVERILLVLIVVALKILEELVFGRDLVVMLEMIHHLPEVVTQAIKVDLPTDRTPSKVEMRLSIVEHLGPQVRPRLVHHSLD